MNCAIIEASNYEWSSFRFSGGIEAFVSVFEKIRVWKPLCSQIRYMLPEVWGNHFSGVCANFINVNGNWRKQAFARARMIRFCGQAKSRVGCFCWVMAHMVYKFWIADIYIYELAQLLREAISAANTHLWPKLRVYFFNFLGNLPTDFETMIVKHFSQSYQQSFFSTSILTIRFG